MTIGEFQKKIEEIYLKKDASRGVEGTFIWFVEEVGELARAIRNEGNFEEELADCAAWLFSIANILGVNMEDAVRKYENGCPKCGKIPCICG
ncbi:nucleotide pyrophosphohydrolase [candidate division WOR-3 bacterium JGI_Cruoil_03_44_89]|uniref:Nucleotide pyrophosphohydrolase n=1 Tax=candidate division WOR-3 bacterium JGI_Cruoil_03_44_89 TaxID=1973748 RepID=A0A235BNW1_UNCW3|nr:MAG: nucleotide pyrophosphohydrolase [candidate division WOR-3 bacterium JGI_Cruoil_03_44_89]